jgi:hypothetical protein
MAHAKKDGFLHTEYVVKCGKQGVFSGSENAARSKINALHSDNAAQGTEKEYTLTRREVFYPGVEALPLGEDSRGVQAEVTEKVIA